jgi:glutamine synthetase
MIEKGGRTKVSRRDIMDLGIGRLPKFNKDTTDRNRTSPFAFTGTKFEFRAVGSSQNISTPLTIINTIIADGLDYVSDRIVAMKGGDLNTKTMKAVSEIVKETKAVRFEGNNYSEEWVREAKRRGLPNVASTYESLKALEAEKNFRIFEKYHVFSKEELLARYHIWIHTYNLTLEIEANTLNEMVNASVVPAGYEYAKLLADNLAGIINLERDASLKLDKATVKDMKEHLGEVTQKIYYVRKNTKEMIAMLGSANKLDSEKRAKLYFEELKPLMEHIRKHVDELECVVSDKHWDLPKYREMLFVK